MKDRTPLVLYRFCWSSEAERGGQVRTGIRRDGVALLVCGSSCHREDAEAGVGSGKGGKEKGREGREEERKETVLDFNTAQLLGTQCIETVLYIGLYQPRTMLQ